LLKASINQFKTGYVESGNRRKEGLHHAQRITTVGDHGIIQCPAYLAVMSAAAHIDVIVSARPLKEIFLN